MNNDKIFEYLNIYSNDNLSKMNISDQINILFQIKQYSLELRNILNISNNITFGLEIEFENAKRNIIESELLKQYKTGIWPVVNDESLYNGGEINSPILTDTINTWTDLEEICTIVSKNAYVLDNTGGHIHIGMNILGNNPKYWANFVKLWMAYENIIFRFLYGEYTTPRNNILNQARPISKDLIDKLESGRITNYENKLNASYIIKLLDSGESFIERRKRSINFTNISNIDPYKYDYNQFMQTIEFRSPNGSFNPIIWQNNINLLIKLLLYAKSDNFDEETIINRIKLLKEDNIPSNIYKYSRIYNEQLLELCDLIFTNNLDKIYFIRQYYKDGTVSSNSLTKSKKFTI